MADTPTDRALTRREFSVESLTALFAGVAITITACGGDSSPSPTSPGGSTGGSASGTISANHGHVATVTSAQLSAGNDVTLNIQGSSDHPHTVVLSSAEVTQVRNGQRVAKTSSTDAAHNHTVTFN
jgi:hypothetical protein